MKKIKAKKEPYPMCKKFDLPVTDYEGTDVVTPKDLNNLEKRMGADWSKRFGTYFGIQTCSAGGYFASDVESVLLRIFTGKLTGSQKYWD